MASEALIEKLLRPCRYTADKSRDLPVGVLSRRLAAPPTDLLSPDVAASAASRVRARCRRLSRVAYRPEASGRVRAQSAATASFCGKITFQVKTPITNLIQLKTHYKHFLYF